MLDMELFVLIITHSVISDVTRIIISWDGLFLQYFQINFVLISHGLHAMVQDLTRAGRESTHTLYS